MEQEDFTQVIISCAACHLVGKSYMNSMIVWSLP